MSDEKFLFSTDDLTYLTKRVIEFLRGYHVTAAVCEATYLPISVADVAAKLEGKSLNFSMLATNGGSIKPKHIIALNERITGAIEDYNSGNNPTFDIDKYPVLMLIIGSDERLVSAVFVSIICSHGKVDQGTEMMAVHDLCVAIQDYINGQYALNTVYGSLFREKFND